MAAAIAAWIGRRARQCATSHGSAPWLPEKMATDWQAHGEDSGGGAIGGGEGRLTLPCTTACSPKTITLPGAETMNVGNMGLDFFLSILRRWFTFAVPLTPLVPLVMGERIEEVEVEVEVIVAAAAAAALESLGLLPLVRWPLDAVCSGSVRLRARPAMPLALVEDVWDDDSGSGAGQGPWLMAIRWAMEPSRVSVALGAVAGILGPVLVCGRQSGWKKRAASKGWLTERGDSGPGLCESESSVEVVECAPQEREGCMMTMLLMAAVVCRRAVDGSGRGAGGYIGVEEKWTMEGKGAQGSGRDWARWVNRRAGAAGWREGGRVCVCDGDDIRWMGDETGQRASRA